MLSKTAPAESAAGEGESEIPGRWKSKETSQPMGHQR